MYVLSPPGVDYPTFDRGYSSLRSYQLESSMGAQALIQHGGIPYYRKLTLRKINANFNNSR